MEKILIVDDSALQAAKLKSILDDEYQVAVAQTAEDGLPLFRVIRHVIISNLKIILNLYGYYRTPGEKVKGG